MITSEPGPPPFAASGVVLSFLSVLTTIFRAVTNLLRLPLLPLWWASRLFSRPKGDWVVVRLRPRLVELPRPRPFFLRWVPGYTQKLPTPISALRRLADHVGRDPATTGVLFIVPPMMAGWAATKALRDVLLRLRASGKQSAVYLPQGGGNREMYLAAAADRVFLGPEATLMALGLSASSRYLRGLLDKLGVGIEAFARGEYKTATESLTRESMSDAQREQVGALLDTLDGQLVEALAARPKLDEDGARALFEHGFIRGEAAVELGFADGVCFEDELPNMLRPEPSAVTDEVATLVRAPRYLAFREARYFARVRRRPYIAVVNVHGTIGESGPGGREHIVAALRTARSDKRALGVILDVDSPGGSALASDLIHREVVRLKEKKPVVALMGEVAASGGYYVSAPADAIVAQPVTITGSIGVISARLVAHELLATLGIQTEVLRRAPHADMFSPARDLTQDERSILLREIDGFYRGFVGIVAEGRGRPFDEIEPLARGRVWSGADALEQGLVDRLGGMDVALEELRSRLQLPAAAAARVEPRLVVPRKLELPAPEPPAASPAGALRRLAPEVEELVGLVSGGERVLYYSVGLPKIE